jgi:hypothetical protein
VIKRRVNWKRMVPFALSVVLAAAALRKFFDEEYIHAVIAGVLALFNLIVGFKGVTQVSEPLSDSMSEVTDYLADGQDGTGL